MMMRQELLYNKKTIEKGFILVEVAVGLGIGLGIILFLHTLLLKITQISQETTYKMQAHYIAQQYMEQVVAYSKLYEVGTHRIDLEEGWEVTIVIKPVQQNTSIGTYNVGLTVSLDKKTYMSLVTIVLKE